MSNYLPTINYDLYHELFIIIFKCVHFAPTINYVIKYQPNINFVSISILISGTLFDGHFFLLFTFLQFFTSFIFSLFFNFTLQFLFTSTFSASECTCWFINLSF